MVDAALHAYYARDEERDRLSQGSGRVEFLRTVEIIGRTLPPPGAVIADIGGGPGRYTDWLVESGYTVLHRHLIPAHVEQAPARPRSHAAAPAGRPRSLELD